METNTRRNYLLISQNLVSTSLIPKNGKKFHEIIAREQESNNKVES